MKSKSLPWHRPFLFEEMSAKLRRKQPHDTSVGKKHVIRSQQVTLAFILFVLQFQLLQWHNLSTVVSHHPSVLDTGCTAFLYTHSQGNKTTPTHNSLNILHHSTKFKLLHSYNKLNSPVMTEV